MTGREGSMEQLKDKILGSLLGAAIGDAMGAATEVRTREQIIETFGGLVRDFCTPPQDTFARGGKAGQVTDDFSFIHCIVMEVLKDHGFSLAGMERATLTWGENEYNLEHFAGPTTRAAILRLRGADTPNPCAFLKCDNGQATNGAGMKASPAGLFHPGDVDAAIDDAILICKPTHNNNLAISGACAVAAAVSKALVTSDDCGAVIRAGIYGAQEGMKRCGDAAILAGPSIERRIRLAVELGEKASNMDQAMQDIYDLIGTGLHIAEAVPAAFGLFAAAGGNAMEAITAAVNIGNDTDTVAAICGAIAGAYTGTATFDPHFQRDLEAVNGYQFDQMAGEIFRMVCQGT